MSRESQPESAGIYCRMSLAVMNDPTKVADQARISRELAAALRWPVGDGAGYPLRDGVYTDNSRTAWQKNRKRPAWDQMLKDVDAGILDAIVIYHGDRLVRQPYDLETLINLADGKGIRLASPTGIRSLDNTDDRFVLRILVAQACMESDNTSRRKKAEYERLRRRGLTRPGGHGGRAFGFESDGVTHKVPDRCEIATRAEVSEPGIVREAAAAIIGGRSPRSVLRELTARGVRSTAGNVMSQPSFTRMLTMPRQAGLMPDGESAAAWEPVLDRETWETLRLMIAPGGRGIAPGPAKYLLSGIARCGRPECGHVMRSGQKERRRGIYRCPPDDGCGRVSRARVQLDAYVLGRVAARLARPGNPEGRQLPLPGLSAEFAALAAQRAETEDLLKDYAKGSRVKLLLARLDSIDARLGQLRGLADSDSGARLRRQYAGTTLAELNAMPLEVARPLVAACVEVRVLPVSRHGAGFDPDDVVIIPR